mgnify:CR=1 FL=1
MTVAVSGILTALAAFIWAGVIAFRSQRWAVWAVAGFSVLAFNLWKPAFESGRTAMAGWIAGAICVAGLVAIFILARRAVE